MSVLNVGDKIGRYEIIAKVGEGGMSIVFEGFDPTLERYVAIKLIKIESFPANLVDTVKERFVREAKALAQLNHPNIVKVFDFGEFEGAPYLVMDYLEGLTFKAIRKPVPLEAAVDLIKPVADALAYIHSKGLLHRDIKASNIILLSGNHPMLTDFGIAKWIEGKDNQPTLTGHGYGLGTPEYMSPEQGMGKAVDHRSDQYSLAIVFYELITGRRPYTDETVVAVLVKQVNEPVPDPRQFVPELSESVQKFFEIALAKNADDRHADMKAFQLDLDGLKLQAQTNRAKEAIPYLPYQVEMDDRKSVDISTGSSVMISETAMRKVRARDGEKPEMVAVSKENLPERKASGKGKRKFVWVGAILAVVVVIGAVWGIFSGRDGRETVEMGVVNAMSEQDGVTTLAPVTTAMIAPETDVPTATVSPASASTLATSLTATSTATLSSTLSPTVTWTPVPTDTRQPTATATIPATETLPATVTLTKFPTNTISEPFLSLLNDRGIHMDDMKVVASLDQGMIQWDPGYMTKLIVGNTVADFVISGEFTLSERRLVDESDPYFGYIFRETPEQKFVLQIYPSGNWYVYQSDGTGTQTVWKRIESGSTNILMDQESTFLELAVIGLKGVFMINGQLSGEFTLDVENQDGGIGPMIGINTDSRDLDGDHVTVSNISVREIKSLETPTPILQMTALPTSAKDSFDAKTVLEDAYIENVFAQSRVARGDGRDWITGLTYVVGGPNVPNPKLSVQICFHGIMDSNPNEKVDIRGDCSVLNHKYYCTIPQIVMADNTRIYIREAQWGACRHDDVHLYEGVAPRSIWDQMIHSLP